MADAEQADAGRARGDERPLLGVPIAVKDSEDVAGEVTGWGTAAHFAPAERDNELVRRLREAGAVILGKTNLPELAIMGDTEGPASGSRAIPGTPSAAPRGSSGGSAAAVAAGLCAAATASDGAGSIRIRPATAGSWGSSPPRPGPAGPASRALVWPERRGLPDPDRRGHRVADGRGRLTTAPGRGGGAPPEPPARGLVGQAASSPRVDPVMRRLVRSRAACAGSVTRWRRDRDPASQPPTATPLPRRHRAGRRRVARPERASAAPAVRRLGRSIAPPRARLGAARVGRRHRRALRATPTCCSPPLCAAPARPCRPVGRAAARSHAAGDGVGAIRSPDWNLTGQPARSRCRRAAPRRMPIGAQLVCRPTGGHADRVGGQLEAELGWPARRPPPA